MKRDLQPGGRADRPFVGGEPLFDFSHRVATTWEVGRKGTDNGALLLVAIRIEGPHGSRLPGWKGP